MNTKSLVVKLGGFNFVAVKLPTAIIRNQRLARRWFKAFLKANPQLAGLQPQFCQVARDWGKPWHSMPLVKLS